ncbi:hypothetical protein Astex_0741 [Asticcacaulis excentricus CB 48]|uniref:CD-NTase-associated protein 12/Pycsar effector protein TIR domain-containing protein n=2 Tax=Asticcacaulis excentricus TaxID=78587 RepID=E8RKE6_ASTEC|nr:hypothetical protein Astex_0741 [Asticcacaulis excentricus CB 48]
MSIIGNVIQPTMRYIKGDMNAEDQKVVDRVSKVFCETVLALVKSEGLKSPQVPLIEANQFVGAVDLASYKVAFTEGYGNEAFTYADIQKYGITPLSSAITNISRDIGDVIYAFEFKKGLTDIEAAKVAKEAAKSYIERVKSDLKSHSKPAVESISLPEIAEGVKRFRTDYPEGKKTAFIIMKFGAPQAYSESAQVVKDVLSAHGIAAMRADDKQYMDDLFLNIKTYMHSCDFAVAIWDRIETDEFNPNVSLEVGYMMALGKDVLLLKDQTLKALPTDIIGRLYKPFDTRSPGTTAPEHIIKWLRDKNYI